MRCVVCGVAPLVSCMQHQSPIPEAETLEIYAFMIAADASKLAGGSPVDTAAVMAAAELKAKRIVDSLMA